MILSDENITELHSCPPSIEYLITDECATVRLSEEIPIEALGAHVHHHISGPGGVSPVVRAWCMDMFRQLYPGEHFPDVPCLDFDLFNKGEMKGEREIRIKKKTSKR